MPGGQSQRLTPIIRPWADDREDELQREQHAEERIAVSFSESFASDTLRLRLRRLCGHQVRVRVEARLIERHD